MEQYPKDTKYIYSYLEARKSDVDIVWFGLQYYLMKYLNTPTMADVEQAVEYRKHLLGSVSDDIVNKYKSLVNLRYLPLKIYAVPEGCVIPSKNVLMTIESNHPQFHWLVGYLESLILKVWNTCTVATKSMKYYNLVKEMSQQTCDNDDHLPYCVHDFGYRGVSSEETAYLSSASHLIAFRGTDTIQALPFIKTYYGCNELIGCSIPASEHSVMCTFGQEDELKAFENMLDLYPEGIVSIVSDSYDYFKVLTEYIKVLKPRIESRNGKTVFRPDSGSPELMILGDPNSPHDAEKKGSLELLGEEFGYTVNSKGYKVLNPKIGLIYGDGMYFDRFERILEGMKQNGWATSNLVIGIGGLLLQQNSRDDYGFALKTTVAKIGDEYKNVVKSPKTDLGKKSKTGFMKLVNDNGVIKTVDSLSYEEKRSTDDMLRRVYCDGTITRRYTFDEVRANFTKHIGG
jgi:nicotinamide phosphoribosyltransferase